MNAFTTDLSSLICSQQAIITASARTVGCFALPAGHATSLLPNAAGELRIAHGHVWVTFANAALDSSARGGDHFLHAGDVLHLAGGQEVVMEVLGTRLETAENALAYFCWEPRAVLSQIMRPRQLHHTQVGVRQSLQELVAALHQVGGALGRLAQGLVGQATGTLVHKPCKP